MEPEPEPELDPSPPAVLVPLAPPAAAVQAAGDAAGDAAACVEAEDEWAAVPTEFCLKHSYTVDPSALLEGRWQISTELLCVPLTVPPPFPSPC
eukprot:COSAG02_NODE_8444_length_2569_cov_1.425506_2_plen_94_part_00